MKFSNYKYIEKREKLPKTYNCYTYLWSKFKIVTTGLTREIRSRDIYTYDPRGHLQTIPEWDKHDLEV